MTRMDRGDYAALYGPTTGDRIRLADTDLWVRVEADDTEPGEELLGGCGKTARDGLLVTGKAPRDSALDMVILGVVVMDPLIGVRKTNIGIKDGRIVGIGRAGNPDTTDGVELVVDSHTAMITGEGMIATAGVVDSHVHLSSPEVVPAALAAGVTSLVGMGIGGVWDVGANPAYNLHSLIEGWRDAPINVAFLARGSSSSTELLERAVMAGAGGFKIHEDWGATPRIVDTCLDVAEHADLPVALHTDTLNESGYLSDTLLATRGRTVHAYHVEGGGGHPDLLEIVSQPHVLTSSTTPTLPLTPATVAELLPMTLTVHRGHHGVDSDLSIAASRVREHAIAAENALHDLGAISIVNSDSMGMGRIAETARRTWQLAHVQAHLAGEAGPDVDNNARVLRYLAKITLNPAIAHGMAHEVGALRPGAIADIVLWRPATFGAQPEMVLKSGFVAWGVSGSGSGSTRLTQPRVMRPYFGGLGGAPRRLSRVFVSQACLDDRAAADALPKGVRYAAIRDSRGLSRADMIANTAVPDVKVPTTPDSVLVDGRPIDIHHAAQLPLTRLHHLA
ncbi:urease subunit alpha [Marinactinospora thermotolerans]|uniref:Urease subunit alpha n=1 Tax=Marinactinospora thermotolerans DSM 45154 TaxID=1122192 RepID=A0A1T4SLF0_9ACTN|nr:urease subunit alpha [Marinactinospora thermotolerans]SKA29120.1 urease subunit alpha [Marinactinospora thermotolerans DSM 45154]